MARRARPPGVTDLDKVQVDPWPAGNFAVAIEEGRRIMRCLAYYREEPTDNGYARPIEGVLATVDVARGEVLEVLDFGEVPLPDGPGSYAPGDHGPCREDLRPLEIAQREGASFTLEGHLLSWQRWSMRVSMHPLEGLVLHTVGYGTATGCGPSSTGRPSARWWSPTGTPSRSTAGRTPSTSASGVSAGWPTRWPSGATASARSPTSMPSSPASTGRAATVNNAVCIHEEDVGILWKHQDHHTGNTEVRRSRRLVVSSIATVGNYEYGFYWYFYLDGSVQLEVKLTGILSTQALADEEPTHWAAVVAPGLAAPFHQHLFCARLDLAVDGPVNQAFEVGVERGAGRP